MKNVFTNCGFDNDYVTWLKKFVNASGKTDYYDYDEWEDEWNGWDDYDDDYDDEDEEPAFFEVTCPACDNTITIDEDVLALGSIQCPNCGEMMEFEFDEDDEEEDD